MKYFVMSDIHGDTECLKKALALFEAEKADRILCLGDILYHGPRNGIPAGYDPQACANLLNPYAEKITAVSGNCDSEVDQLLLAFPISAPYALLTLGSRRLFLSHGHRDLSALCLRDGDILLTGHTHLPKAEVLQGEDLEPQWLTGLDPQSLPFLYHINPGSVSLPKGGNPPSYAILTGEGAVVKAFDQTELCRLFFAKDEAEQPAEDNPDIEKVLFSAEQIHERIQEMGQRIAADYADKKLLLVGILKGANMFMADLSRAIPLNAQMDFMIASSYGNAATSSGHLQIVKDLSGDLSGKHILLVEDLIDTGLTLHELKEYLISRGAASVKIAALLDKPDRRTIPVELDYVGFQVPNEFIIGYGIDYAENYRTLPFVGVLKRSVYEPKA